MYILYCTLLTDNYHIVRNFLMIFNFEISKVIIKSSTQMESLTLHTIMYAGALKFDSSKIPLQNFQNFLLLAVQQNLYL